MSHATSIFAANMGRVSLASVWCLVVPVACLAPVNQPRASAQAAPYIPQGLTLNADSPLYEAAPQQALDLTDEVTLEAWVQADRMGQDGGRILDKSVPFTLDGYVLDTYPGNSLRFSTQGGAVSYDAKLPADKWTHVVGVYSAPQRILKLYVDGREVASRTNGSFPQMTLTKVPLRIGADPKGENRFRGRIQRAAIYGRALTSQEIAQRFAAPQKVVGVLGDWEFGAVPGTVIKPVAGTLSLTVSKESDRLASPISATAEPMQTGKFQPTWESLKQYQTPEWFRDAKFGIWAHWGPQCEPEAGDWYARAMYEEGSGQYKFHVAHYGHPSQFGFKDVIHKWKAENWDPAKLMALYKRAGAQYFVALANHHDNFDNFDSKYQPWNSVKIGPKQDLIGGWAKAARDNGLRFGVSVHAAHAWTWYELAQGADKNGALAGVPYDGNLTAADGKGKWWDGLDPQELYAQNHTPGAGFENAGKIHSQWNWGNGASIPDVAYCDKFYNRTVDLINKYQPDLIYFDDTILPLYPISDAGLKIATHFYNHSMAQHDGKLEAVLCGKILDEEQRKTMVWDIERGQANQIEPYVWQTDTCIGSWHYDRRVYERNGYKSAKTVIQTLADIVSKNGNLLLSVPVRGDGTIDEKEVAVVEGIAAWMDVNRECIFGTRPWKVFGEGPASAGAALSAQGFNEGRGKPFTAQDFRFTAKGNTLYAIALGWPQSGKLTIKTLAKTQNLAGEVRDVQLLGAPKVAWTRDETGLVVTLPQQKPCENAWVLKIEGLDLAASQPTLVAGTTPTV